MEIVGVGGTDDIQVDVTMSTEVEGDIRFNITTGLMESCKMSTSMTTTARDLEDDGVKKLFISMNIKIKQKLQ